MANSNTVFGLVFVPYLRLVKYTSVLFVDIQNDCFHIQPTCHINHFAYYWGYAVNGNIIIFMFEFRVFCLLLYALIYIFNNKNSLSLRFAMLFEMRKRRFEMIIWLLAAADRSGGNSTYLPQQDKLSFVSNV